jgi:hypothetical protein
MPQKQQHENAAQRQAAYRRRRAAAHQGQLLAKNLPPLPVPSALPGEVRWKALCATALAQLNATHTEMTAYYDQRSEAWQEGDRAQAFQERIEALEELTEQLLQYNSDHFPLLY